MLCQVARALVKPLEKGDSHARLLIVTVPVFDVTPSVRGILPKTITHLPTVEPRVGTLHSKGGRLGNGQQVKGVLQVDVEGKEHVCV
jgi:hypothetical protein